MKRFFDLQAKRVLHRLGYVANPIAPRDLRGLTDDPLHAAYIVGHRSCIINVPLSDCRTIIGFPITPNSLHPFVRTIRHYIEDGISSYDHSSLKEYHEHFQPKTVAEFFALPGIPNAALVEFPASAYVLPWDNWSLGQRLNIMTAVSRREHLERRAAEPTVWDGSEVDSASIQRGETEFRALLRLCDSVRKRGYVRHDGPGGDILVTPLIDNESRTRYLARAGKHRIAVLAALGFEYAPLRVRFVPVARLAEVDHWPHVKDSLFTREQAAALFERIFEGRPPMHAIPPQWLKNETNGTSSDRASTTLRLAKQRSEAASCTARRACTDAPLITIGITCFNAADTIRRAVMSAIRQDWPRKEIIAVDDASTDGSWRILEDLAKQHQIVLLRHAHNKGVACARNSLLCAAQGEFIAYFDDDDESYPNRLSKQWERIAEYRRCHGCEQVFCTAVRNIAINGQIHHQSTALGQKPPEPHGKMVADYLLGIGQEKVPGGLFGTCVLMANVSLLRGLGGFDLRFRRCAEWDLAVRGAFWGVHFIAVDEPLIVQHKTRGAEKAGSMPLRYSLLLREKHKEYLKGRRLYWASRAMARSNFHGNKGRIWKSRGYTLLACLISPRFFYGKLARKLTWPLRVAT